MKNLLLILVLADILIMMWGAFQSPDREPGVTVVNEADLGPLLEIANIETMPGSDDRSPIEANIGPFCLSIGPFTVDVDADSTLLQYASEGMRTALRSTREEIFVGHWVQIRNIASDSNANTMLATLKDGGLPDAYPVRTDEEGLKISLGLFGDLERAEKIELQARSVGLPAVISPRIAERDVKYVDVRLPPGKGAGAIIAKYGEDRVKLRAAATCPR